jgi:hypothetical protein
MRLLPQLPRQSCPAGATFSEPALRKSVASYFAEQKYLTEAFVIS